jgi:heme-degrading monooxygenase HmoA/quinol monooxygenase YgiN
MFARLTRAQSSPDQIETNLQAFTSTALPRIRSLPGYAGAALAVDRQTGASQVVTFWDSEESLKQSAGAAAGIRTDTLQASGGQVTSVDEYEVALMERVDTPSAPSFLRVMRGQADPAKLDALVQATREQALPVLRTLSGFRAVTIGIDRQSGRVMITGVWASAEAREASNSAMADTRSRIFAEAGASQPEIALFEVLSVEFVGVGATTT